MITPTDLRKPDGSYRYVTRTGHNRRWQGRIQKKHPNGVGSICVWAGHESDDPIEAAKETCSYLNGETIRTHPHRVKHYRGGDARDYGQHEKYVRPECEVSPKQRAAMETPEAQAVITTLDRRGVPYEFKHHEAEDEITAFVGDQLFQIENLGLPRQDLIVETISDELLMFVRRHGFTVWQVNQ